MRRPCLYPEPNTCLIGLLRTRDGLLLRDFLSKKISGLARPLTVRLPRIRLISRAR